MEDAVLKVQEHDEVTTILTLNRPNRRNALTIELMQALVAQFESLQQSTSRRVVILCGAGPVFCAGLDLVEAADVEIAERSAKWVARTFESIVASPLVTIAAVQRAAMAGGAGLMAACDFAIGTQELQIGFPEVRRGLVPALVSTLLCDRLRDAELRELLILAEPIDAQRALTLGLVYQLVPADELMREALVLAERVAQGAPQAIRATKRLLRTLRTVEPEDRLKRALECHKQARRSREAQEGLAAFRERRDPDWSHS